MTHHSVGVINEYFPKSTVINPQLNNSQVETRIYKASRGNDLIHCLGLSLHRIVVVRHSDKLSKKNIFRKSAVNKNIPRGAVMIFLGRYVYLKEP